MKHSPKDSPLQALGERINKAKAARAEQVRDAAPSPHGAAMRMGLELVSGFAVGALIGFFVDDYFGTMPIFFLTCIAIGTAAGVKNMMQSARRMAEDIERAEQAEKDARNQ
ncbi:MAG: F0F1 ATP synthase subunit I [Rickettsiales bacterium]|nr:F0F1 ATP synthase subunit I [Rickettsiales bacterium]|tara:strand:- start:2272 stop:2604 length:333 start_codon:yes stop_codon:yes gene_type:complete